MRTASGIRWCAGVIDATKATGPIDVPSAHGLLLARGMEIRLPAMTVGREVAHVSSFDLWLQRGSLLSTYRPDPSFLRVPVQLARPLGQGELAGAAASAGFEVPQAKSIRYRYIDDGSRGDELEEEGQQLADLGNWRRKLFTWTHLGEWCSEDCYLAHRDSFRRRNSAKRGEALAKLRELGQPALLAAARDEFMEKMEALWIAFGPRAPEILRGRQELDHRHYQKTFEERVARDLALTDDDEFERRYINGFEFVQVPRFRNDVAGWGAFVDSIGRQIAHDWTRGRSQSLILHAIVEATEIVGTSGTALEFPEKVVSFLRNVWREEAGPKDRAARAIALYHKRDGRALKPRSGTSKRAPRQK
jgi:hypothetical protein